MDREKGCKYADGIDVMGWTWEKEVRLPPKCVELAEFVGIMLGDGNIQCARYKNGVTRQIRIAFHSEEREYQEYVERLVYELFGLTPHKNHHPTKKEIIFTYCGKQLVHYLLKIGLKAGDKVKNQVSVPLWVYERYDWMKACLRGLMDSDGSIYKMDKWHQICFKNSSRPLLRDFQRLGNAQGLFVSRVTHKKVYISRRNHIRKFFNEIGVRNKKHEQRYRAITSPMV